MAPWNAFPYDATAYLVDTETLKTRWARLHRGDAEPLPDDEAVLQAWALFHGGRFMEAHAAGIAAGPGGITVANKAQSVHANYLETSERARLSMFLAVAERAAEQAQADPASAAARYWQAYALARYSDGTNVARAAAQGLGAQIRAALEAAVALAPLHADAHVALGVFHADVIDRVGRRLGKIQGADPELGLRMFERALALNPTSASARVAYANGLVMIDGERRTQEAEQLYVDAAACAADDALERLEVELARSELEDD